MAQRRWLARAGALAVLASVASVADAQTRVGCERAYKPQRGQEGKDVVWAPTEDAMLVRMLQMANVTPADRLYDLGSGDGKIPIAAAKHFGATAVGIEYDAELVEHARCLAAAEGVRARTTFIQGDIFETDFSDATVVTLYLLPALNLRLRPTLLAMTPGTRIVSYSFTMGEWESDRHIDSFGDGSAYLYIVPAYAAGSWTFRATSGDESFDVQLEQTFQKLRGRAGHAAVTGGLTGDKIDLAFMDRAYEVGVAGSVAADRITAMVTRRDTSTGRHTSAEYVGARR